MSAVLAGHNGTRGIERGGRGSGEGSGGTGRDGERGDESCQHRNDSRRVHTNVEQRGR
jgi:hypothetical protein